MEKCSKCLYDQDFVVKYAFFDQEKGIGSPICLCHVCDRAYDIKAQMLIEFLKDDFGTFPINKVQRNMINARKERSLGLEPGSLNKQLDMFNDQVDK